MRIFYDLAIKAAIISGKRILEIYDSPDFEIEKKADDSPLTKADKAAHNIIVETLSPPPGLPLSPSIPILSEEGRSIPYSERSQWKTFWLVDPLDGTKEFIKKNGEFTVNIALIENNKPIFGVVYAPVLDELYVGIVGQESWLIKNPDQEVNLDQIMDTGTSLPLTPSPGLPLTYTIVASRSHLSPETQSYIDTLRTKHDKVELTSIGSSLKLCMVAKGEADEYPRLGPTMEWDTAAAHAVVNGAGKGVYLKERGRPGDQETGRVELTYNKENLLNPYFIVK